MKGKLTVRRLSSGQGRRTGYRIVVYKEMMTGLSMFLKESLTAATELKNFEVSFIVIQLGTIF